MANRRSMRALDQRNAPAVQRATVSEKSCQIATVNNNSDCSGRFPQIVATIDWRDDDGSGTSLHHLKSLGHHTAA
jgi:hypothetical protein